MSLQDRYDCNILLLFRNSRVNSLLYEEKTLALDLGSTQLRSSVPQHTPLAVIGSVIVITTNFTHHLPTDPSRMIKEHTNHTSNFVLIKIMRVAGSLRSLLGVVTLLLLLRDFLTTITFLITSFTNFSYGLLPFCIRILLCLWCFFRGSVLGFAILLIPTMLAILPVPSACASPSLSSS